MTTPRDPWFGVLQLDTDDRLGVARALALGRREMRRNGLPVPTAVSALLATLVASTGQDRTRFAAGPEPVEPVLIGYEEAGRLMGVSPRTVSRMVAGGDLPAVRLGRRRLLRLADVREMGANRAG